MALYKQFRLSIESGEVHGAGVDRIAASWIGCCTLCNRTWPSRAARQLSLMLAVKSKTEREGEQRWAKIASVR